MCASGCTLSTCACDEASLDPRPQLQDLRHSHAAWLLAGGAELQIVKERLGHGSIVTTGKYLHTLPTADETALTALHPRHVMSHTDFVTTKERLHQLVDELPDEKAPRALALLESVTGSSRELGRRRVVPSSLGAGASARTDVSERVDEILAEGFGR